MGGLARPSKERCKRRADPWARCLNHSLGGLVAVYDQHDYMTERRAALELWASFLLACESGREWAPQGGKVVPLRGRTA